MHHESEFELIEDISAPLTRPRQLSLHESDPDHEANDYDFRVDDLFQSMKLSVSLDADDLLQDLTDAVTKRLIQAQAPFVENSDAETSALRQLATDIGFDVPSDSYTEGTLVWEPFAESSTAAVVEALLGFEEAGCGVTSAQLAELVQANLDATRFCDVSGVEKGDIATGIETAAEVAFEVIQSRSAGSTLPFFYRDRWAHFAYEDGRVVTKPTAPALLFPYADTPAACGVIRNQDEPVCAERMVEVVPVGDPIRVFLTDTTLWLRGVEGREVQFDVADPDDGVEVLGQSLKVRCSTRQPLVGPGVVTRPTDAGWLAEWDLSNDGTLDGGGASAAADEIDVAVNRNEVCRFV